jgi:hypothetical protein
MFGCWNKYNASSVVIRWFEYTFSAMDSMEFGVRAAVDMLNCILLTLLLEVSIKVETS